eukprot:gene12097-8322_t
MRHTNKCNHVGKKTIAETAGPSIPAGLFWVFNQQQALPAPKILETFFFTSKYFISTRSYYGIFEICFTSRIRSTTPNPSKRCWELLMGGIAFIFFPSPTPYIYNIVDALSIPFSYPLYTIGFWHMEEGHEKAKKQRKRKSKTINHPRKKMEKGSKTFISPHTQHIVHFSRSKTVTFPTVILAPTDSLQPAGSNHPERCAIAGTSISSPHTSPHRLSGRHEENPTPQKRASKPEEGEEQIHSAGGYYRHPQCFQCNPFSRVLKSSKKSNSAKNGEKENQKLMMEQCYILPLFDRINDCMDNLVMFYFWCGLMIYIFHSTTHSYLFIFTVRYFYYYYFH